ncbi:hypothetical protein M0K99_RS22200 [Citrobacter freundii]|uniref:Uncharacterized protein n=1 Tax=Citrobacter freundii TaxID=546 RepID=A0AAN4F2N5_CITFR|nr:hypothetical protein [Citrobacter freundii]NCB60858.1 hypothetical protein [Gammaproteobacteria bacterium]EJD6422213.1 hypothetical protein [Citrobacter freundii]EJD6625620.1 hypothetical protein [Citrobacter freundii]EKV1390597.1 hypothetical protein [Citrobacter freundii]EKW2112358.1 hypothetical protein [Citrobacter freundii]
MADANSTTNACFASSSLIPQADLLYFPLAEAFRHHDCSHLTTEENLALSFGCEEALAGLYHTLNFMGESLLTMSGESQGHFSHESVCQLGHSLVNISQLIPALARLEAKADQQLFASDSLN